MNTTNEDDKVEIGQEDGMEVDIPEDKISEEKRGKVEKREEISLQERQEENEELAEAGSDTERETIRARRREERHRRKQIGRERNQAKDRLVASLQMQVQDLNERLARVDQRQSGTDYARLEEELGQAIRTANEAQEYLKNAIKESDGEQAAAANELYYTARRRAEYLAGIKQKVSRQETQQPATKTDPKIIENASQWVKDHSWYNHSGDDVDSMVAKAVDNGLVKEGYDPRTKEYWEELNDRLEEKLPHRFNRTSTTKKNGSHSPPVAGSERNSSNSGNTGGGKFYLSAARVQAIKDSGAWDDETARNKLIKRYQEYDRNQGKKE